LSPPFFETSPRISNNIYFSYPVFFVGFLNKKKENVVDARVPVAPPLGQIGHVFDRMWCHCLSILVEVLEGRVSASRVCRTHEGIMMLSVVMWCSWSAHQTHVQLYNYLTYTHLIRKVVDASSLTIKHFCLICFLYIFDMFCFWCVGGGGGEMSQLDHFVRGEGA